MLKDVPRGETDLLRALQKIVGPAHASNDLTERIAYIRGTWPVELKRVQMGDWGALPAVVVRPANTEETARVMQAAGEFNQPVVPNGGGSGIVGGTALFGSMIVDVKRLNAVHVNDTNLTVTAGAGVIGWHLEEQLDLQGYTLGHFPQSMNSACVGGLIATASTGIFSGRYGRMEDMLVAMQAVLPSGAVLATPPIPRRSVGPNLNHLFIGSEGALGIITEATLRIWPKPATRTWAVYTFPDTNLGLEAVRQMARDPETTPALVRLYDEAEAAKRMRHFGYPARQTLLILGFEGSQKFVEWQEHGVEQICLAHQGTARGEEAALHWYRYRFDTSAMLRCNQTPGGAADALEVAAPWDRLEKVWRAMRLALEPLCEQVHCHFSHVYPTGGSVYVIFYAQAEQDTPQAAIEHYQRCLQAAMEACLSEGGSLSHHHGIGRAKHPWMEAEHNAAGLELMGSLKQALDPRRLLNPGVLGL
jgi:alkyldihydroxyacetonephosphate synthase